jgi:phenylacetate-CoA ligase
MIDLNQLLFKYGFYYPAVLLQGQNVPRYLRYLRETQRMPIASIEAVQLEKLRALVAYARANVPHYQGTLAGVSDRELLRDGAGVLPFLSKGDLQNNETSLIAIRERKRLFRKTTGGSTGQSVTIWKNAEAIAQEHAANWRGFEWAGIRIGDRQARFWGVAHRSRNRFRAHLIDFVGNRRRCSAFSFGEQDMREYTRLLNRFRPTYLYGYVSMLQSYAEYLTAARDRLEFQIRAVVPTSEVLTASHRKLFETAFKTSVFNEYGCGEFGTIAHECERGAMHINAENLIVEVLRDGLPCGPGEIGELVITDLNNFGMPLIRYRLSDFGSLSGAPCPCGRTLPVIEKIFGRAYDLVRNREGKVFHGEFFMYIFEDAKRLNLGVRSFQVVQKDVDSFVINVVPSDEYGPKTEEFVRNRIREKYSKTAEVAFKQMVEIPREASGKMRLIVAMKPVGRVRDEVVAQ